MDSFNLNTVTDAIPLAILRIDSDERVDHLNAQARSMIGDQAMGRHYLAVLRQPEAIEAIERSRASATRTEVTFSSTNTTSRTHYRLSCAPLEQDDPAGPVSLVTLEDISEIYSAGRARREFVANVSHELRTPLTALSGFIETLQGAAKNDPEAQERFLAIMEREASRMNRLIHDLLSLSRIEGQERQRPTDKIDLAAPVQSAVDTLTAVADQNKVKVELHLPPDPMNLPGDADQLQQVFTNLIENAIKYGHSGGRVTVTATAIERDARLRGTGYRIDVADFGDGIAEEHLTRLMERFYRVDNHRSREMGGTGLGLAIVKHIVNRHRGHIRVHSELGKGSTFSVLLPAN